MTTQEDLGDIKINNEVVSKIASLAVDEVEGMISLTGRTSLAEMWGRKDQDKGFRVEIEDNSVTIHAEVNVEYGIDIYKGAHQLQVAIKNAVETMTGLIVSRVNVSIREIVPGEQPIRPSVAPLSSEIKSIAGNP